MAVSLVVPILNVSDISASLAWFEQLGWETRFVWKEDDEDGPGFAGIGFGQAEIFLCLDGQGARGGDRPASPFDESTGAVWMSWFVESLNELEAMHARAVELGLDVTFPPTDVPWGLREFHLRHPDGHTIRVGAGLGR